ncbi:MAG TPA: tRNA pseudouridine(55) synthase TruB [bacterium]|nr:tRNA pseudouridine(55) synthase TruB [bacterium]HPQ67143.1 tRNA pseudouridine(55) synthase TruB [bacterium]
MPGPRGKDAGGIMLVDKPAGITSFGVVARIRRRFKFGKVGHGGTLDPMATGLLIVLCGKATRTARNLLGGGKEYRAEALLGRWTDTQDATGRTLGEADPSRVTREELEEALEAFRGEIEQVPPMVSALKFRGKPLYKLAREGKTVERSPRKVTVSRLELVWFRPPLAGLEVACSGGTYVRTLIHDLGLRLGCGACLASLRRTRVGPYRLEQAFPLEKILEGEAEDFLLPAPGGEAG